MLKVGQVAPNFTCQTFENGSEKTISLKDLEGRYTVLFFYPFDFTFVCPTELHAFQDSLDEFKTRNTDVIGASVDSIHSHRAWLNTPKMQGGIEGVTYPLISDIHKTMAQEYGVFKEDEGNTFRGLFLLDKDNVVQHVTINNNDLGRSTSEILRLIDALQFHEKHGDVCPANWQPGKKTLKDNPESVKQYFQELQNAR